MQRPTKTQLLNAGIVAVFAAIMLAVVYALIACTGQDPAGIQPITEQIECACPVGSCECSTPPVAPAVVPTWTQIDPTSGWSASGGGIFHVTDNLGIVHLTGTAVYSAGASTTVLYLPRRPMYLRQIPGFTWVSASGGAFAASYAVEMNGAITVYPKYNLLPGDVVYLDGISFVAAP